MGNNTDSKKLQAEGVRSFSFDIELKANDLWTFYMYNSNRGHRLLFNIIFTIGCLAYLVYYWNELADSKRYILIFFSLMFTVLQPLLLYRKAILQAKTENMKAGFTLQLSDSGIDVSKDDKKLHLDWEHIYRSMIKKYMIVLYTDNIRGYLIPARCFASQRKELNALLTEKTKVIRF